MTQTTFLVKERHGTPPHALHIVEPAHAQWVEDLGREYGGLRAYAQMPLVDLHFNGVEVLDMAGVRLRLLDTQVPEARGGNFDVARADLGEVALCFLGTHMSGYRYGYRSTRDREAISLPGRGIDQIGVAIRATSGGEQLILMLGEAKVSFNDANPLRVVDLSEDCLRNQHLGHLADLKSTIAKVWKASLRATDQATATHLQLAARFLEHRDFDALQVRAVSLLVRSSNGASSDFGTFLSFPSDFHPAEIEFWLLRTDTHDVDGLAKRFVEAAKLSETDNEASDVR